MRALSLFSGIGGLDLAAHAVGIETVGFCEIEPFACRILAKRFPGIPIINDVREVVADGSLGTIDVVHGGFPCQDLSVAGKQRGLSGGRSGLWYEMLRVISELRPAYVLAENVRGACNLALPAVVAGLEGEGYEVRASVVPAAAFGAPHKRERLFVLGVRRDVADSASERLERLWSARKQELEIHAGKIVPVRDSIGSRELWPTPRVNKVSGYSSEGYSKTLPQSVDEEEAALWRTPDANASRGPSSEERYAWKKEKGMPISINDQVKHEGNAGQSGQLSPLWVEILMGYPLGWTDPDCDEPEPWPGWPAMIGEPQFDYEPPRTVTKCADRAKRLKCLGNAVVPQQAYPFFEAIAIMEEVRHDKV